MNKYYRFLELMLLKKQSKLSLSESEELSKYEYQTNSQLNWCFKQYYLHLLIEYDQGKLSIFDFGLKVEETQLMISDIAEILQANLIFLEPDKNSTKFLEKLLDLSNVCSSYIDNIGTIYDENDHSDTLRFEEEHETRIKELYVEIKNSLDENIQN